MTDLLLSELVALLLLLPVLLRPFSKSLKRGNAIPILPFLSLFVCICIIIGQGIVLSLFLLILFVLIVCLSEIIRLIAFTQGVLNDFYGIASVILRIVLSALFCGIVYCVFTFAPEANIRTEYPLTIRPIDSYPIDSPTNPIEGLLIERQGGADKRALVIIAEALPYSGKPETLAALLADQGYTVAEITGLEPRGIIPRIELYRKLLPLIGKKEQRYLAKEDNPEIAASFASFLEKTVARYGRTKRIFLYAEGIYTDLAAHFCTENPGVFTGVFFCLSEEEPLPSAPEGWARIVREQQPDTTAEDSSAADTPAAASELAASDQTAVAGGNAPAEKPSAASAAARQSYTEQVQPLPFCFYIRPYSELAGFGSLRAEDILAAKLLGSGRSIGRQDKAAAAAAFDRYAVLF
ncbi:hypothetical protein HMPREF1222_00248 [Treponema vincentii F0403]|uniref:Uncharacterized protein n=1 Tax=Treponema vincentii F0403 TaxID=1125702 RepID=S3LU15_9SPIR|nr:hypothetical protein [Treponema vincentii]EPF47987.1 hypothetical protein HMPREF1222_00248 [Treponema vincentii F0403]